MIEEPILAGIAAAANSRAYSILASALLDDAPLLGAALSTPAGTGRVAD